MVHELFDGKKRALKTAHLQAELVIVGGGLSGVCAAITAARAGIKVILVQDRPVLGGNASSEVRLWILGATSHMGNNNRWAREGGVIDEILIENAYRNKEGNPVILDTVILDMVRREENINLLLNTAVYDIRKSAGNEISHVMGFCSQNYTFYEIAGNLFCDASGDGIVAYRAGASFRMGAEERLEFGEKFCPDKGDYGELLGHSIYFYSKDTGKPVMFVPPSYALKDITQIPRHTNINSDEHGCKFWWLEYGGRLDTIHDTENIKWELWSVVYGVWDYIKNSGKYPDAENLTLEWIGVIPGKRESRRFLGHYTLIQQDIIEQRHFYDAVAFGGWAIDLHPADGVYSKQSGCIQYHSKGVYQIPYRCFISKDIKNLFYAGRCISASHVAHGSSRVMATAALGGQAVGMAAALCSKHNLFPEDICSPDYMKELQQALNIAGQSIPQVKIEPDTNLASTANIEASSTLRLKQIPFDGSWIDLNFSAAQMLPMAAGQVYQFRVEVEAAGPTSLEIELWYSEKPGNYTPDVMADKVVVQVEKGIQKVFIPFTKGLASNQYGFLIFRRNENVRIRSTNKRYTGILSVFNKFNRDVNNNGRQVPPPQSGIDSFEFWCPERRPEGRNISMDIYPEIDDFHADNLVNGCIRPTTGSNAWIATLEDRMPKVCFSWDEPQIIREITLYFDTDYDHALESVQMGHPENVMPFCVRNYKILDENDEVLFGKSDNYQTINKVELSSPVRTSKLQLLLEHPLEGIPAALFQLYVK